jgi:hypothetical protein
MGKEYPEGQFEEALRLYYDFYKHLTTLSTGSILIIVALLEKVFVHPKWKAFVVFAFAFLLLTILGSLTAMTLCAYGIKVGESGYRESKPFGVAIILLTLFFFVLGVTSLVVFATKNLYS